MTLTEQLDKAKAQGLRLLGFYVAKDVYAALCKTCERSEHPGSLVPVLTSELMPLATGLIIVPSEMIPSGHVAPYFADKAGALDPLDCFLAAESTPPSGTGEKP